MEALEKKGHRSLAKAKLVKPSYNYNAPSRHKRSKRLETSSSSSHVD